MKATICAPMRAFGLLRALSVIAVVIGVHHWHRPTAHHLDIAEVRTEEGKLYLFVAIDRISKFAYTELHDKANRWTATHFFKALIKAVPYKIHTVLTDNRMAVYSFTPSHSLIDASWMNAR